MALSNIVKSVLRKTPVVVRSVAGNGIWKEVRLLKNSNGKICEVCHIFQRP